MWRRNLLLVALVALVLMACQGGSTELATRDSTGIAPRGAKPVPVRRLPAPRTAAATARAVVGAERALRADAAGPGDLRRAGWAQQLAYRQLAAHPDWASRARREAPRALRGAVQGNVDAGAALAALTGVAPAAFPHWRIRAPAPAATLRSFYDEAQRTSGIPWAYLAAIHLVETRMGRIHGPSSAGAQGPMQFIPATWARYGQGDINDDHDAILAAGRYLAASGGRSNIDRALFSYNNDNRYVAAIKAYADVMLSDPRAYDGYYQWQVFYSTVDGAYLLPEGYGR